MRGLARVVVSLVIGSVALVACTWCRPDKPSLGNFIVPTPRPPSFTSTCAGDTDCLTAAADIACAVSAGCVEGRCRFNTATTASCPCYENDIRWCPTSDWKAQFCVRVDPTSTSATQWQVDTNNVPVCGPNQVDCKTGRPECPDGKVGTKYDLATHTWIPDAGAACVPTTSCVTAPPCDQRAGTPCGCGGTWQCDGSCSHPGPANLGQACGSCGGTWQCDGSCSRPDPANLGQTCGCGGTVGCDGSCSNPGPPNLGQSCGGRCGGTIQCDGTCPLHERLIHTFEGQHRPPIGCGHSYNRLKGSKSCGPSAIRHGTPKVRKTDTDGGSHCELVTWTDPSAGQIIWANQACGTDPNHRWGNSNIREACDEYFRQGATHPTDQTDCRYIFHVGTAGCAGLVCDLGHDTSVCQ